MTEVVFCRNRIVIVSGMKIIVVLISKRRSVLIQVCLTLILGGFELDSQGFSGRRTPKECVMVRSLSAQSRYMIHYDAAYGPSL